MNLNEYISSGILEAYALGELSEKERSEVEKNLISHPELKAELDRIEEAQELFLTKSAVQPSASVKTNLLNSISTEDAGGARLVSIQAEKQISFWRFAAAASISVALITAYLSFSYYGKWKSTESNLATLIAQNQQVAQDYNRVNQRIDRLENEMKVMDNPKFQKVVMAGTSNAPAAMASVYWNENTKEVYLSLQNMKELAQDNQYQLWAIIDGKPVDAGVFDGNFSGLHKMKEITKGAVAFAVTIEPRGGKASPTMDTMQVMGKTKES